MIEINTTNLPVKTQRRTWRTNVESALGQPPVITAYREQIMINADDGSVISRAGAGRVDRVLGDILGDSVTLADGTRISGAQLAEALPLFLDQWETEDLAPPVAPAEEVGADPAAKTVSPASAQDVFTGKF